MGCLQSLKIPPHKINKVTNIKLQCFYSGRSSSFVVEKPGTYHLAIYSQSIHYQLWGKLNLLPDTYNAKRRTKLTSVLIFHKEAALVSRKRKYHTASNQEKLLENTWSVIAQNDKLIKATERQNDLQTKECLKRSNKRQSNHNSELNSVPLTLSLGH